MNIHGGPRRGRNKWRLGGRFYRRRGEGELCRIHRCAAAAVHARAQVLRMIVRDCFGLFAGLIEGSFSAFYDEVYIGSWGERQREREGGLNGLLRDCSRELSDVLVNWFGIL